MANVLPIEKRVDVVRHLVEGASVRSTSRLTDVSLPTVLSTLLRMGDGCDHLHNLLVRDLDIREIELDEIWSYVQKKQARVTAEDPAEFGDAYAYLAMSRTKKLMIAYRVGKRDEANTRAFVADLRARLVTIPEISTDGWQSYPVAVGQSFGGAVDHAVIQKDYSKKGRREGPADHRYEPPRDPFITKKTAHGAPNLDRASTSHVERANLTVRMHVRRFTRLCNGFSKKIENHRAAVSLHVAWYNFCRVHESLRVTPAMEAGITDHVWSVQELVERALAAEPCAPPEPKKLAPPASAPGEKPSAARELPNGKGWLRALPGGKGKPSDAPRAPTPPPPAPPARVGTGEAPREPLPPPGTQLDLFAWRPRPRQLGLFDPP
ncbi:IS1 family transposase [Polyangium mundeleinium]|uniref:IS1 family transposase n=1 Tax=Polyangium mundeleinium TaxID=2995306 RepID=A0ABT5EMM9_9BACT|nr:IS1 family transposase [Polyangium mundeleinium]MDC0742604.1 IS1 family transposase [Polyangium mundeleinium]